MFLESYAFILLRGQELGYLAVIPIGTPPRDFTILMDSGSADFWVGAESCIEVNGDNGNITNENCVSQHSYLTSLLNYLI